MADADVPTAKLGAVPSPYTYSERAGCPVKFHWSTTIAIDGSSTSTTVVKDGE